MAQDCIFCGIRDGRISSEFLLQDEVAFVIRDINPRAPVHLLVIPREHISTARDLTGDKLAIMGHLVDMANTVAQHEGVQDRGYRLVVNCGPDSGMEVSHLHLHVLGGRRLGGMA